MWQIIKNIYIYLFFQNRYPIMVKCLNIWENIGKPIYRSISSSDVYRLRARLHWMSFSNLLCSSVALLCKQALDRHFWPSRMWNGVIKCFCENGLVRATGLWRRILYWINFTVEKYISTISVIVLSVSVDVLIHVIHILPIFTFTSTLPSSNRFITLTTTKLKNYYLKYNTNLYKQTKKLNIII